MQPIRPLLKKLKRHSGWQPLAGLRYPIIAGIATALVATPVHSANWFKLRGTEASGTPRTLQVWGFLQPSFVADQSSSISGVSKGPTVLNGDDLVPGTLPPDRTSDKSFFLRRARIGIRGAMLPINDDINYFILTEFGDNGLTRGEGAQILDASVTFNQGSRGMDDQGLQNLGARVRVGQFLFSQTSEAHSQSSPGRRVHNFMPEATRAFSLRRPASDNGAGNFPKSVAVNGGRDVGIEAFDYTEFGDPATPYEFTYSAALGNGGTINELNRDDNLRQYYWLSIAKLFDDSRGPRRHDAMLYGFYQEGDVEFNNDVNDDGTPDNTQVNPVTGGVGGSGGDSVVHNGNERDIEQEYYGIGVDYMDKPFASLGQFRFNAEWQKQEGLVFDGPQSPSAFRNTGIRYDPDGESTGWYADLGYDLQQHLPWNNRTTINARFDTLDRNEDDEGRAVTMDTWSLTGEYFFHKKARATLTYQIRDFDTDDRSGVPKEVGNDILDDVDNRIGAQVTFIFKNVLLN